MDKTGIVIPCFNNLDVLKQSIPSIYNEKFIIILSDDNSSDGTSEWISKNYPKIIQIKGDGNNWWTGSLAIGISKCLDLNCKYIVSVNADVIISDDTIFKLIETSKKNNNSIVASLVVDINKPDTILWAGSFFKKIHKIIPIFTSKYIIKAGNHINNIPHELYETDEVHGRGVLIPSHVIKKVGNYDGKNFPHYGGDNDFSFRVKKNELKMFIDTSCIAKVYRDNTSLNINKKMNFFEKIQYIYRYLFKRKNGEALFVWFKLYKKHLGFFYFIPSYLFIISLNIFRKIFK